MLKAERWIISSILRFHLLIFEDRTRCVLCSTGDSGGGGGGFDVDKNSARGYVS